MLAHVSVETIADTLPSWELLTWLITNQAQNYGERVGRELEWEGLCGEGR